LIILQSWDALEWLQRAPSSPIVFEFRFIAQNPSFDEASRRRWQEAAMDLTIGNPHLCFRAVVLRVDVWRAVILMKHLDHDSVKD